jgi:hypothetical protein
VFRRGLLLTPAKISGGTQSLGKLCQNGGFGLLSPVTNYHGQRHTGFGIFLFMLIIYHGQHAPMAALSRKMAFGLPNFLAAILPFQAQSYE